MSPHRCGAARSPRSDGPSKMGFALLRELRQPLSLEYCKRGVISSIAGSGRATELRILSPRAMQAHADEYPPRSVAKELLAWFEIAQIQRGSFSEGEELIFCFSSQ